MSRLRKRLLWVYDNYDPFVFMTVLLTVLDAQGPPRTRNAWQAIIGPPLAAQNMVPKGGTFDQDVGWVVSVLRDPALESREAPMGLTVPLRDAERRMGPCLKLVPAFARWVRSAIEQDASAAMALRSIGDSRAFVDRTSSKLQVLAMGHPDDDLAQHRIQTARTEDPVTAALLSVGERVAALRNKFRELCDWYTAARPNLGAVKTWQQALNALDAWHSSLGGPEGERLEVPHGPVVYEWPDGYRVVELTDRSHLIAEGRALRHCIGAQPEYIDALRRERARFFSLRNAAGAPLFTFEVAHGSGQLIALQIKGCKNRSPGTAAGSRDCPPPDPTECVRVYDFLAAAEWAVGPDYWACWDITVTQLGTLNTTKAGNDPTRWPPSALVRPQPHIDPGGPTKRFHPHEALEPRYFRF
jgi:hypothetical protein